MVQDFSVLVEYEVRGKRVFATLIDSEDFKIDLGSKALGKKKKQDVAVGLAFGKGIAEKIGVTEETGEANYLFVQEKGSDKHSVYSDIIGFGYILTDTREGSPNLEGTFPAFRGYDIEQSLQLRKFIAKRKTGDELRKLGEIGVEKIAKDIYKAQRLSISDGVMREEIDNLVAQNPPPKEGYYLMVTREEIEDCAENIMLRENLAKRVYTGAEGKQHRFGQGLLFSSIYDELEKKGYREDFGKNATKR